MNQFSKLTEEELTMIACESATHVEYYHSFAIEFAREGVIAARKFGHALNALRAKLNERQWKEFLQDRFPDVPESALHQYMQIANHRGGIWKRLVGAMEALKSYARFTNLRFR